MSDPADDLREDFVKEIRRRFRRLRGEIRRWVGYEHDVFGLSEDPPPRDELPNDGPDVYRFATDPAKINAFMLWFQMRLSSEVLQQAEAARVRNGEHWTAEHVRSAYGRAWQQARTRLRTSGVDVDEVEQIDVVFDLPVSRRALETLYTRTYENLESVTEDAAEPVRETLARGLDEGWNARKTADELTKEVRTIQHTQAEVLARTESQNAYSEGTLDRYERAGADIVSHGEWSDANDTRVCPICKRLDGREFTIAEMRTGTFSFDPGDDEPDHLGGEYPLKPPAHPNGRCVILPKVA
jgi:SPP1 gp7 family putative phage head morphogenesis protein